MFGLSLDGVADLARFAEAQELPFRLLSDPDGSVADRYGVLPEKARFARRVTFVIDGEGVLRHVDESVKVDSHGADLVRIVRELRG